VSKLDDMLEPEAGSVHRLEVISGTGRRRSFSDEFKARVVEETLAPVASSAGVAPGSSGLTEALLCRQRPRHSTTHSAVVAQSATSQL
jgi:transposase-like protein